MKTNITLRDVAELVLLLDAANLKRTAMQFVPSAVTHRWKWITGVDHIDSNVLVMAARMAIASTDDMLERLERENENADRPTEGTTQE